MTPPDANLKKQRRRHWPVFWGIAGAFALAILAWLVMSGYLDEPAPEDPIVSEETTGQTTDGEAGDTGAAD